MSVDGELQSFPTPQGAFSAFVSTPVTRPPWPTLIIIHPVTGLDEQMRERARNYALEGYLAVAPDVYSDDAGYREHDPKHIERAAHIWLQRDEAKRAAMLDALEPELRAKIEAARAWNVARKSAGYAGIVRACFDYVQGRGDAGKIGVAGYCMGGRLSGELAASGAELAAAVVYYGPHPALDAIPNIRCPMLGHYAVTDGAITPTIYPFAQAMHAAGKSFNYSVYDADHAFGEPDSPAYDAAAARLAFGRTREFLERLLR